MCSALSDKANELKRASRMMEPKGNKNVSVSLSRMTVQCNKSSFKCRKFTHTVCCDDILVTDDSRRVTGSDTCCCFSLGSVSAQIWKLQKLTKYVVDTIKTFFRRQHASDGRLLSTRCVFYSLHCFTVVLISQLNSFITSAV